jgi:type II secretory pathway pseudopilin PulG
MIELLAVVTLIVILAAMTIGGLSYFNRKQAESKARMQIKLLANALEDYKSDNGEYPLATQQEGKNQTEILWRKLYEEGAKDESKTIRVYLGQLAPNTNNQRWLMRKGASYMIVDPFGFEFRYRRTENGVGMKNPDFDLWSVGPDGKTNPDSPNHRDNKDDIWD